MTDITTAQAHRVLHEALDKAAEFNTLMNIAVVDAGGGGVPDAV